MITSFLQVSMNSISQIVGENNIIWINISFCILNFLFASLSTFINMIIKLRKYDARIDTLIKLVERIYGLNTILKTELTLSNKMRVNASHFIKKYASEYSMLLDIDIDFPIEDLQI